MKRQASEPTAVDSIRARPGMYIGDTRESGVEHLIYELVANGIDQFLGGHATTVEVLVSGDQITVRDDGPGLPYDKKAGKGGSRAEHWLTSLHATPTADGHLPHVHLNPHGVGLMVVTALSQSLHVITYRNGYRWEQAFEKGHPVGPVQKKLADGRGTFLSFVPDRNLLQAGLPRLPVLRRKLFDSAHLFSGVTLKLDHEIFHAAHGLADYAGFFAARPDAPSFSSDKPQSLHIRVQQANLLIEASAIGSADRCEWLSWCNGSHTLEHGSHVDGFRDILRRLRWNPAVAMIHVIVTHPNFAGPCRNKLVVPELRKLVRDAIWTEAHASTS